MPRDGLDDALEDPLADSGRLARLFAAAPPDPPSAELRARGLAAAERFAAERGRTDLPAGAVVGPYEIIQVLGSGGQATVYRARDRGTGREVALKVPRHELAERLHRETQILLHLDHPRIVRIEAAALEGRIPYLAMEHLRGGSLADLLARGERLPRQRVEAVAEAVLEALEYAHARGVVHRDVKPANILFDERGEPKVADFGIGKVALAWQAEPEPGRPKSATVFAGTPAYMAPEQEDPARTEGGRIDGRADLYALGKVLYEMLTGRQPRTIRPLAFDRNDLPAEWTDFLFHLVEDRPRDRYASAEAAKQVLRFLVTLPAASGATPAPRVERDVLAIAARAYEKGYEAARAPRPKWLTALFVMLAFGAGYAAASLASVRPWAGPVAAAVAGVVGLLAARMKR